MKYIITILLALLISTTAAMAAVTIKLRGDTAANWTTNNPILALREPGVETDTSKIKIGDGVTAWASLPYAVASGDTVTVFSGTIELNTTTVANAGVIQAGSSQILTTAITATGVLAASDGVDWYFVGDPVAKTGFVPGTSGMITLWPYVSADGYIQVRIVNNTASSITLNGAGNGATIKLVVRR